MYPRSPCASVLIIVALVSLGGCTNEAEKFEQIELSQIYATNGQKGLKELPENKDWEAIRTKSTYGASNVFLLRGKDVDEAIKATRLIILAGGRGDSIEEEVQGQAWMVLSWGVGSSSPPKWTIHSVEKSEKSIRVHYREHKAFTDDIHHYYAWVPLGSLKPGKYTLEVWSHDTGEKMLQRLCKVLEKNQ
jgi:hypothetical protein